jgi:CRP-like cAMP-binding protein
VLQGLDYLHCNQVVHGDLKPANLLRDSNTGKVKIVDFGSSMMCSERAGGRGSTAFSTPAFRSPESLQGGYQLSYEIDMWALGVCCYLWAYGCLPFEGASPFVIYDRIRSAELLLSERAPGGCSGGGGGQELSPQLRAFLAALLEKNPVLRLDVAGAMAHEWVSLGGEAPLVPLRARCGPHLGAACPAAPLVVVGPEDIESAIRQMEGAAAEQVDVAFDQLRFSDREAVIVAGEVADKMYLVASGEVEICQDTAAMGGGGQPLISGVDMAGEAGEAGGDLMEMQLDLRGGADAAPSSAAARRSLSCMLDGAGAAGAAAPAAAGGRPPPPQHRRLLAVRGPGHSFGLPSLAPGMEQRQHVWRASVRARGPVTVFVAKVSELRRLVEQRPELAECVRQMVMQQETDMMVAEAMRQLRLYNDAQCCGAAAAAQATPPPPAAAAASAGGRAAAA